MRAENGTRRSKLPPVKQRKHESANVPFCDPVRSTGVSKHEIKKGATLLPFLFHATTSNNALYVPASQEDRYSFCSLVRVSILIPIDFSFNFAIISSMAEGTA